MAEVNPRIRATSDPVLARRLGLTHWDAERGQYVAAPANLPQERPGEGVFFQPESVTLEPLDEGGEDLSRGISSSTSSDATATSSEPGKTSRRRHARTTDSPS